jgi:hypothetical protein
MSCIDQEITLTESVLDNINSIGREAEFKTFLIKGGRTTQLYIRGAENNLNYKVVAIPGVPKKEVAQDSSLSGDKALASNIVPITGIKIEDVDTAEARTIISLQMPEFGFLWPTVSFYVEACPIEGMQPSPQQFVSLVQAQVSSAKTSHLISVLVVILIYLLAANGVRKIKKPEPSIWKALNPFRLTSGIFGRSSVSNLQIFIFTLIIIGLLVYVLLRTGQLSDISANVAYLLGIVGVGTGAARISASKRQLVSAVNLSWIIKRGWIYQEPAVSQLVTERGEFSVTRFQSIAFSFVVAIALLFSGPINLAEFTIPDTILGLLFASQAIYVGGKWIKPDEDQKEFMKSINTSINEVREAEKALIDKIPPGIAQDKLRDTAQKQKVEFENYKEKAGKAINLIVSYFELSTPKDGFKGIYGTQLLS